MISRKRCAASAVTTAELTLPLFSTIASSLAMVALPAASCGARKYHLQDPWSSGQGHRLDPLLELHPPVDQTRHVHALLRQSCNRFPERPAPTPDYTDLVDHHRRQIQQRVGSSSRLQHHRPARPHHLDCDTQAFGAFGTVV